MRLPLALAHAPSLTRTALMPPVIGSGCVFAGDRVKTTFCIDSGTGATRWHQRGEYFFPFAAAGDIVLVSDGTARVRGLAADSGTRVWERSGQSHWTGEELFFVTPERTAIVDLTKGVDREQWPALPYHTAGAHPSGGGTLRAIVGRTVLYESHGDAILVAYDVGRGALLWQRPFRADLQRAFGLGTRLLSLTPATPRVIVAAGDNGIAGASMDDGSLLWHAPIAVTYYVPAIDAGCVYVMRRPQGAAASLVCLDAATGQIVYDVSQPLLQERDRPTRGVISDGHIAFGTEHGLIALFRLSDGIAAWSYRHKAGVGSPAIGEGLLAVASRDGKLLIFQG